MPLAPRNGQGSRGLCLPKAHARRHEREIRHADRRWVPHRADHDFRGHEHPRPLCPELRLSRRGPARHHRQCSGCQTLATPRRHAASLGWCGRGFGHADERTRATRVPQRLVPHAATRRRARTRLPDLARSPRRGGRCPERGRRTTLDRHRTRCGPVARLDRGARRQADLTPRTSLRHARWSTAPAAARSSIIESAPRSRAKWQGAPHAAVQRRRSRTT